MTLGFYLIVEVHKNWYRYVMRMVETVLKTSDIIFCDDKILGTIWGTTKSMKLTDILQEYASL